jgi:cobalt-zinc-cadmium efflux system membrane fusion protein
MSYTNNTTNSTLTTRVSVCLFLALLSACTREATSPATAELPTLNVTSWTDKTELFMEYPVLVTGHESLFAVHLTRMNDFSALNAGRPRLELTPANGGAPVVLPGNEPSRPGAFRVLAKPPAAGTYRWALVIDAPGLSDRHDLGTVTVFPDEAAARAYAGKQPPADAAAIAYLKEQQWTNAFATVPVQEAELRASVRAPAMIHPLPGGEAVVSAPAAGRLVADVLPSIGDRVRAGQILARIEPRLAAGPDRATLLSEVAEAQSSLDAARIEQTRAEGLVADRALPARRAEEAQRAVKVAEARLTAAQARLEQRDETLRTGGGAAAGNAFALRAPISGKLAEVNATLGAAYDEGASLFKIVRTDRLELEVQVPAADAALARQATGLALEIPGLPEALSLKPDHVHDPGVIDASTHALPLQMEIENRGETLLVGQVGTAILYMKNRIRLPAVPSVAVLTEAGRPYVFVQTGGESFARRFVDIAAREGDIVGIKSGVSVGDRVVTKGAYEVQLASAAKGLPAEGHVH